MESLIVGTCLLLLLLQTSGVYGSTWCSSTYLYSSQFCSYGCCSTGFNAPCCSYSSSYFSSISSTITSAYSVGAIIGIVFGALVGLGIIIAIIVAIVSCCCKTTRVVNPQPVNYAGHTMTVFQTSTSGAGPSTGILPGQPQPYYGYGQGPPPYSQKGMGQHPPPNNPQGPPPPAYSYTSPAFPPTSTSFNHPPPNAPSNHPPPPTPSNQPPPPTPNPFSSAVNSASDK